MSDLDCFRDMWAQHYDFMKQGTFVDVSFKVGGAKIGAHKIVLASCSKVFRAMFETKMRESQTAEVEISDVDENVFAVFLEYIYLRKDENIEKHLDKLVMLADKYDVQPLISTCERIMKKSLNADNAIDYLKISELYSREELRDLILGFIKRNLGTVVHTDGWVQLKTDDPKLLSAVLFGLINDRSGSKIRSFNDVEVLFCDAVIKIGSCKFPVHKFILAEKSAQLLALFEEDPTECEIEGVTVKEFETLMEFVYLDKLPVADDVDDGILRAAHRFALQGLVDHSVAVLKREIDLENAVAILITASSLQLAALKSTAVDFIIDHLDSIKLEKNWGALAKYPDLLMEIYIKTNALIH